MKEYFIIIMNEKKGPISFNELVQIPIYDTTLVWKNGWYDWKKASEIDELSQYIIKTPPPTPDEKRKMENSYEYDNFKFFIKQNAIKYLGLSLSATLLIEMFVYKMAFSKNNYSDLYPIYLTEEQRNNPSSFFIEMLPTSVIIGFVFSAIAFAFYYFLIWNSSHIKSTPHYNSKEKEHGVNQNRDDLTNEHNITTLLLMSLYGLFGPFSLFTVTAAIFLQKFEVGTIGSIIFSLIVTYFGFRYFKKKFETKTIIVGTLLALSFFSFFLGCFLNYFIESDENSLIISVLFLAVSIVLFFLGYNYIKKNHKKDIKISVDSDL